jgi:hypothetical protein
MALIKNINVLFNILSLLLFLPYPTFSIQSSYIGFNNNMKNSNSYHLYDFSSGWSNRGSYIYNSYIYNSYLNRGSYIYNSYLNRASYSSYHLQLSNEYSKKNTNINSFSTGFDISSQSTFAPTISPTNSLFSTLQPTFSTSSQPTIQTTNIILFNAIIGLNEVQNDLDEDKVSQNILKIATALSMKIPIYNVNYKDSYKSVNRNLRTRIVSFYLTSTVNYIITMSGHNKIPLGIEATQYAENLQNGLMSSIDSGKFNSYLTESPLENCTATFIGFSYSVNKTNSSTTWVPTKAPIKKNKNLNDTLIVVIVIISVGTLLMFAGYIYYV